LFIAYYGICYRELNLSSKICCLLGPLFHLLSGRYQTIH